MKSTSDSPLVPYGTRYLELDKQLQGGVGHHFAGALGLLPAYLSKECQGFEKTMAWNWMCSEWRDEACLSYNL